MPVAFVRERFVTSGRHRLSFPPAVQALLLQLAAFAVVAAGVSLLEWRFGWRPGAAFAAFVQGLLAALFSRMRRMAPWWPPIQFVFPLAAVAVRALHLPSSVFLGAFVVLALLYWSTYRTQVPFYPSGAAVRVSVCELLPSGRPFAFVDIGSGFGGLVMHVARQQPLARCVGVELAPLPWLASRLRALGARSRASFVRADYHDLDLSGFDVVFAYLSPAAMPALWAKARNEMRSGALLLSYEFGIPGAEPDLALNPRDGGPALYGWRF